MYVRLDRVGVGLLLILVAGWLLIRNLLHPGAWFVGATWSVLALGCLVVWWLRRGVLVLLGAYFLGATAAFAFVRAYLPGGLPGSFYFVFLALGCFGLYYFSTRPALWPVALGAIFLAIATAAWVVGLALHFAMYLIPAALVIWGIAMLTRSRRRLT